MTEFIKTCGRGELEKADKMINEKQISKKIQAEALCCAAESNKVNVVKFLMKRGVSTNHKSNAGLSTLMYAAYYGHLQSVKELLKSKNIKINQKSKSGKTALNYAIEKGNIDIIRLLVKHGAVIYSSNKKKSRKVKK